MILTLYGRVLRSRGSWPQKLNISPQPSCLKKPEQPSCLPVCRAIPARCFIDPPFIVPLAQLSTINYQPLRNLSEPNRALKTYFPSPLSPVNSVNKGSTSHAARSNAPDS